MSGQASDINEVASCRDFALHEDRADRDALAHTLAATGTRNCVEQATAPTTGRLRWRPQRIRRVRAAFVAHDPLQVVEGLGLVLEDRVHVRHQPCPT